MKHFVVKLVTEAVSINFRTKPSNFNFTFSFMQTLNLDLHVGFFKLHCITASKCNKPTVPQNNFLITNRANFKFPSHSKKLFCTTQENMKFNIG